MVCNAHAVALRVPCECVETPFKILKKRDDGNRITTATVSPRAQCAANCVAGRGHSLAMATLTLSPARPVTTAI